MPTKHDEKQTTYVCAVCAEHFVDVCHELFFHHTEHMHRGVDAPAQMAGPAHTLRQTYVRQGLISIQHISTANHRKQVAYLIDRDVLVQMRQRLTVFSVRSNDARQPRGVFGRGRQ
jgi:hypothetical protein